MKHLVGIGLIIVGCLFLFNNLGWYDFDLGDFITNFWPLALILFGGYMIYTKTYANEDVEDWDFANANKNHKIIGSKKSIPKKIPAEGLKMEVSLGELKCDLTETEFSQGENKISASVGTGELDITIPKDIATKITCTAGVGSIYLFGEKYDGIGEKESYIDDNYDTAEKKLLINAKVGMGEIKIHHP